MNFFVFLLLLVGSTESKSQSTFVGKDFIFLSKPYKPRALLVDEHGKRMADLGASEISYCAYLYLYKNGNSRYPSFISYGTKFNTPGNLNEFHVYFDVKNKSVVLDIREIAREGKDVFPKFDTWTHVCTTWSGSTGTAIVYLDGVEKVKINNYLQGQVIRDDGYLVVGQDQDQLNGGFHFNDAFNGRITQLNGWKKALTPQEVKDVKNGKLYGDFLDWRTANWALSDHLLIDLSTAPGGSASCSAVSGPPTPLTICHRIEGETKTGKTYNLLTYVDQNHVPQLSLVLNNTDIKVVIKKQVKTIKGLSVKPNSQNWCFVWPKNGSLKVIVDGCLHETLAFKKGTSIAAGGQLYVGAPYATELRTVIIENAKVHEEAIENPEGKKPELVKCKAV